MVRRKTLDALIGLVVTWATLFSVPFFIPQVGWPLDIEIGVVTTIVMLILSVIYFRSRDEDSEQAKQSTSIQVEDKLPETASTSISKNEPTLEVEVYTHFIEYPINEHTPNRRRFYFKVGNSGEVSAVNCRAVLELPESLFIPPEFGPDYVSRLPTYERTELELQRTKELDWFPLLSTDRAYERPQRERTSIGKSVDIPHHRAAYFLAGTIVIRKTSADGTEAGFSVEVAIPPVDWRKEIHEGVPSWWIGGRGSKTLDFGVTFSCEGQSKTVLYRVEGKDYYSIVIRPLE